jgi:fructose-1,6-bisphosphatase/inositol monophosphatase family enzyme
LTSELETALSAARRAGEVLHTGFGAEHAITYKGEVDFVTEVDKEAERVRGRPRRWSLGWYTTR